MEKDKYIKNLEVEMLVAFEFEGDKHNIKSGRIFEIYEDLVLLKEFSGQMMLVRKENIIWVKTGKRWPREIFLALRGDIDED